MGGLSDQAQSAANSDKGGALTGKGLKKAGDTIGSATGGKLDEKADGAQNAGDESLWPDRCARVESHHRVVRVLGFSHGGALLACVHTEA